jgi:hypothetical protein
MNPLNNTLLFFQLHVVLTVDIGEAPLARNNDLLTAGELIASATEGFLNDGRIRLLAANGKKDLADIDTGNGAIRLAPRAAHTRLEPALNECYDRLILQLGWNNVPIGASTRQHLVDAEDVEGVYTDSQVERVFPSMLCHILIGTDTGSF